MPTHVPTEGRATDLTSMIPPEHVFSVARTLQ